VWNNANQSFVSKNKYRGREIKTADFFRVLRAFIDDGERLLVDHVPYLLQKLHNLAAIILALDGFRFYGCSLLLIYDGDRDAQNHFARHSREAEQARRTGEDTDTDHARRPNTITTGIPEKGRRSRSADVRPSGGIPGQRQADDRGDPSGNLRGQHHQTHNNRHNHSLGAHTHRIRGEINLRVVDFAHTTTGRDFVPFPPELVEAERERMLGKGYETKMDPETGLAMARFLPRHPQTPDMGFIFGLKSVSDVLREIWDEEMRQRRESGGDVRELPPLENGDVWGRAFPNGVDTGELST
jgi:hypothetical protein